MPPLTLAEFEMSSLRSELHSIESLLDDVLRRHSLLLSRVDALQQRDPRSSECPAVDVPGPSDFPPPSGRSVAKKGKRFSLPLFAPEDDGDSIPLYNFFAPLQELAGRAPDQAAPVRSKNKKRRTPPTSPSMSQGKRARRSSPPLLSVAELRPVYSAPLPSSPRPNEGPVSSAMSDDVICAGDPNPSLTVSNAPITDQQSLSPKISVYDSGCVNHAPEILIIGDSIIRNVVLPGSITFCISGGKTADLIELAPALIDLHPSAHIVILHTGTNDVMSRQSLKLHHDLESLVNTIESLGKICVLSGPVPTLSKSSERFSRLYSLHMWMQNFATATGLGFVSNFDWFWTEHELFKTDGLHLNRKGTEKLIHNFINFIAFSLQ